MNEYMVCYTINGKGYSDAEPWIDTKTEDPKEARQAYDSLVEYFKYSPYETTDVWVEAREVGPWERVDVATLAC